MEETANEKEDTRRCQQNDPGFFVRFADLMRDHYIYFVAFAFLMCSFVLLVVFLRGRYLFFRHRKVCKGVRDPKIYFGLSEVVREDVNEIQVASEDRPKNNDGGKRKSLLKKHASNRKSF